MDFHRDPNKAQFRHRYIGQKRPGWFRKRCATWIIEQYIEGNPPAPEMDSVWYYREVSRVYDFQDALLEYRRFTGTN